jgi:hypothetical protein
VRNLENDQAMRQIMEEAEAAYEDDDEKRQAYLERRIDLKRSLWSKDRDTLEGYAPGLVQQIDRALADEERLTLYTAPRKEVRYGMITIDGHEVDVFFRADWDEASSQLPRIPGWPLSFRAQSAAEDAIVGWYREQGGNSYGENVVRSAETFDPRGMSLDEALARIDAVEERLIEREQRLSEEFAAFVEALATKAGVGG